MKTKRLLLKADTSRILLINPSINSKQPCPLDMTHLVSETDISVPDDVEFSEWYYKNGRIVDAAGNIFIEGEDDVTA